MTDFEFTKLFDPEFRNTLEPVTHADSPREGDALLDWSSDSVRVVKALGVGWEGSLTGYYYLQKVPRPVVYEPGTSVSHRDSLGKVRAIRTDSGVWVTVSGIRYTDQDVKNLIDNGNWRLIRAVVTEGFEPR